MATIDNGDRNNNIQDSDMEQAKTPSTDIRDSESDQMRLQPDTVNAAFPDVKDIPGQEHITSAGIPAEMRDTTIASDDEEGITGGTDILADEDDDLEIVMGTEADVTKEDLMLLGDPDKDLDMYDDEDLSAQGLDDTDFEGDSLNESSGPGSTTGGDLIVPGSEDDDAMEDIGEEDEENNYYSLGSDDNDNTVEGTP